MPGTIQLVGGANITLSQSENTITISASAGGGYTPDGLDANAGPQGNTVGMFQTISMYPMEIPVTAGSVPLSQSISAGAGGGSTASSNTLNGWVWPMVLPANLRGNFIRIGESFSIQTSATSQSGTFRHGLSFGIYQRSNSTLNLVSSWTHSLVWSQLSAANSTNMQFIATIAYGNAGGSTSLTTSTLGAANSAQVFSAMTGLKYVPLNATNQQFQIPAGQYWGLLMQSSTTTGLATMSNLSFAMSSVNAAAIVSELGDVVANITTPYPLLGQISWAMTSNSNTQVTLAFGANSSFTSMPSSFHVSQLTTTVASANTASLNQVPFIQIMTRGD